MLPKTSENAPFVGLSGTANTLKVERSGNRVVCRLNPMVRTVAFAAMGLVGLGIAGFAFQSYPNVDWTILLFVLPFVGGAVFLSRKLGSGRRLEIDPMRKELAFFDGGPFPKHRLGRGEIRAFSVRTVKYEGENATCDNYIAFAETRDEGTAWLCVSTDPALVEGFLEDCRKTLGGS